MSESPLDGPDEIQVQYEQRLELLDQLAANLGRAVAETLEDVPHIDRIAFRSKSLNSFVEKARDRGTAPPYTNALVEIEDQVAGRVITFFLDDLELVKERLRSAFNPVEITHRRPKKDDEFGYESHHLILIIPPHLKPPSWDSLSSAPTTFEVQVRTLFMHAWSEPQHDLAYKRSSDLSSTIRRELSWVAASAWGADQALSRVWNSQLGSSPPAESR